MHTPTGIKISGGAMQFDYTVTTPKPFDQVVAEIQAKTPEKGMSVLHVHDVAATLKGKGFEREPLKIIEICNAKYAHAVLKESETISLMMPCKINVYLKDGKTIISAMLPTAISRFFPEANLGTVPEEVEKIVRSIVDEVK